MNTNYNDNKFVNKQKRRMNMINGKLSNIYLRFGMYTIYLYTYFSYSI